MKKTKSTEEEDQQRWLAAHYAAIEYMQNMDRSKKPISRNRRILRIGLLLVIRLMQVGQTGRHT